ncbi:hypothetical protein Cgig2_031030 [Carnegiea gigantea]|uniref:Uncharacterized protein n=1 Tax=Carnegiea gigantea TaxID=171969 RepID=A0A9Q1KD34_9CARY|nr:hypothetical protein Cgig2_031030 [Carnegiea gigantea]
MQERLLSAAASTSCVLRKGFSATKDKVALGKTKVEEIWRTTLTEIIVMNPFMSASFTRWQMELQKEAKVFYQILKGAEVFGVVIEMTVQRQLYSGLVQQNLGRCMYYLIASNHSSLRSPYLFKVEGMRRLFSNGLHCATKVQLLLSTWFGRNITWFSSSFVDILNFRAQGIDARRHEMSALMK